MQTVKPGITPSMRDRDRYAGVKVTCEKCGYVGIVERNDPVEKVDQERMPGGAITFRVDCPTLNCHNKLKGTTSRIKVQFPGKRE